MDWTKLTGQIVRIRVKNVVESPLKYALCFFAFTLFASVFSPHVWVTVTLLCLAVMITLIAIFGYIYFSIKNPDYLRSEDYHLKKQSLEILGDKNNTLQLDGKTFVDIVSNTHQPEELYKEEK